MWLGILCNAVPDIPGHDDGSGSNSAVNRLIANLRIRYADCSLDLAFDESI